MSDPRISIQFSCGAASAVAAKLALSRYAGREIIILNAFIQEEHADNRRFAEDCAAWFGRTIWTVQSETYNASTHEVWRRKRFMKGLHGAPCSRELKRIPLLAASRPDDVWILGYTVEEEDRLQDLRELYPNREIVAPLVDEHLTKEDCFALLQRAGIELPMMYRLGFPNANCIGCPKAGQRTWQRVRHHFPEQFVQIQTIQDEIGPGAYFLQFRSGPRKGERMPLRELPEGPIEEPEENYECSLFCASAEASFAPKVISK